MRLRLLPETRQHPSRRYLADAYLQQHLFRAGIGHGPLLNLDTMIGDRKRGTSLVAVSRAWHGWRRGAIRLMLINLILHMTTTRYSDTQDTPFPSAPRPFPTRPFGRDAIELPVLGLGGQSLIQRCPDDDAPVELIGRALDLGIRYIDTAPLYGPSERRVGIAIKGRRCEVFIATKTGYRRGSSARRSLERSTQAPGNGLC